MKFLMFTNFPHTKLVILNVSTLIAIIAVGEWSGGYWTLVWCRYPVIYLSLGKHHPYCLLCSIIPRTFLPPFIFTHCFSYYNHIFVCEFLNTFNINIHHYSPHFPISSVYLGPSIATLHILSTKISSSLCCIRSNIYKYFLPNLNVLLYFIISFF